MDSVSSHDRIKEGILRVLFEIPSFFVQNGCICITAFFVVMIS